jgi:hypothetical protein
MMKSVNDLYGRCSHLFLLQVLDELGIQLDGQLGAVPTGGLSTGASKVKEAQPEAMLTEDSLQARLDQLKK